MFVGGWFQRIKIKVLKFPVEIESTVRTCALDNKRAELEKASVRQENRITAPNRGPNAKHTGFSYNDTWPWKEEAVCCQTTQIMEIVFIPVDEHFSLLSDFQGNLACSDGEPFNW